LPLIIKKNKIVKKFIDKLFFLSYILIIILSISFSGCNNDKVSEVSENIRLYHQLINDAANHIVCFEYKEAMEMYKKAFEYKRESFAIDIYNKMHVAIFIEDFETMLECAKRLVSEKGLSLNAFEEAEGYRNFREQTKYWERFKDWYPEGRENFLNSSNQEHITLFRQVLEDDQKFRRHPERYTTYRAQNDSMDQVTIRIIKDYIQEFGYPNENRIGVFETFGRDGRAFTDFLVTPLRHYYGNFEKFDYDLTPILIDAVLAGDLHPELLKMYKMQIRQLRLDYVNLIPGRAHEAAVIHLINHKPFITSLNQELIGISDSLRAEVCLSDSNTLFSKAAFSALNKELPFNLFYVNEAIRVNFSDEEQKKMFIDFYGLQFLDNGEEYIHCN